MALRFRYCILSLLVLLGMLVAVFAYLIAGRRVAQSQFAAEQEALKALPIPASSATRRERPFWANVYSTSDPQIFERVVELDFGWCGLGAADARYLGAFRRLRVLELMHNKIGDTAISYISNASELERLGLSNSMITDAAVRDLNKMRKLYALDVSHNAISDEGVTNLHLPLLEHLNLDATAVTDEGIISVVIRHPHLRTLALGGTGLSDAGLKEICLKAAQLESVLVGDTNVTSATVLELEGRHPRLRIYHH
jgi:hypothetical protein